MIPKKCADCRIAVMMKYGKGCGASDVRDDKGKYAPGTNCPLREIDAMDFRDKQRCRQIDRLQKTIEAYQRGNSDTPEPERCVWTKQTDAVHSHRRGCDGASVWTHGMTDELTICYGCGKPITIAEGEK